MVSSEQRGTQAICGGQRASLRVDAQDTALAGGQGLAHPHLTVWKLSTPRAAMVCELSLVGRSGFRSGPLTTRPLKLRVLSRQSEYVDYAGAYLAGHDLRLPVTAAGVTGAGRDTQLRSL